MPASTSPLSAVAAALNTAAPERGEEKKKSRGSKGQCRDSLIFFFLFLFKSQSPPGLYSISQRNAVRFHVLETPGFLGLGSLFPGERRPNRCDWPFIS